MRRRHMSFGRPSLRTASVLVVLGVAGASGCLSRPLERIEPNTSSVNYDELPQSRVDKIDLLLAIDNSRSMADKQAILATAVPDLVKRLVAPDCVDDDGNRAPVQPPYGEKCPAGFDPEFKPILDMHIGIVSSSLGGYGSPTWCIAAKDDDHGRLVARKKVEVEVTAQNPDGIQYVPVATYDDKGFLAWDPEGKQDPAGEKDLESGLKPALKEMVEGVGQTGCGFEAQLESVYRFLVDPTPYLEIDPDTLQPSKLDEKLLQERREFLRPDSLLAVIMLSDENDCSLKPAEGHLLLQDTLWRPRTECASNPNDPCCKSCAEDPGECPVDDTCYQKDEVGNPVLDAKGNEVIAKLTKTDDPLDLRCWDQKRRFGHDFRFPIERYVEGFKQRSVKSRDGSMVPNPIFTDLDPNDDNPNVRDESLVFFAGIVGVPWQDIARDPGDLSKGLKSPGELTEKDPDSNFSAWDLILGDPKAGTKPLDPLMGETPKPRSGTNPLTGESIAPVTSGPDANSVNGHEHQLPADLQYACTFELPEPRDCTKEKDCDCKPTDLPEQHSIPLCQADDGTYSTMQLRAKAYPGVRQLEVLKGLGNQGIVSSVCPSYLGDEMDRKDYGYAPAVGAIVERLKTRLNGKCLPRSLTPDSKGHVACLVIEARKTDAGAACSCDGAARIPVSTAHQPAIDAALENAAAGQTGWNCFCEIPQLSGDERKACQNDKEPVVGDEPVDGWCYIDATTTPKIGNADFVEECPETEQRQVRFVGAGEVVPGGTLFITCSE